LEYALKQKILLATPTSLVGLLRAIAYGWNQDSLSKSSEEIQQLGGTLYDRLQTLTQHLNKLGHNLDTTMDQFNKVTASYSANTLPAVRRLAELGISSTEPTELNTQTTTTSRQIPASKDDKDT